MASLDEISFTLGRLTHSVEQLNERAQMRDGQIAHIKQSLDEIKPIVKKVTDMEPHVDHYKKVRRLGAAVVTFVLAIFGTVGGAASNFLFKKFGGG